MNPDETHITSQQFSLSVRGADSDIEKVSGLPEMGRGQTGETRPVLVPIKAGKAFGFDS
jgi:hypothetical protein